MGLAVVRSLDAPRRLATAQELEDYEQELVDQYLLAAVGAGMGDKAVGGTGRRSSSSSGSPAARCGPPARRTRTGSWPISAGS
jgi:hypothetical protein